MNISIDKTELVIGLIETEIGYWSAPEHEDIAIEFSELLKTFKKSLAGKQQYKKIKKAAEIEQDELPSYMKSFKMEEKLGELV